MKVLAVVDADLVGPTAVVQIDYDGKIPIEGSPPRPGLLELDCPGLQQATRSSLLKWLASGGGKRIAHGEALPDSPAGALDAVPESSWRVASFAEAVELKNFDRLQYLAVAAAPLHEISACLSQRIPALLGRIDRALERDDVAQIGGLKSVGRQAQRAAVIVWGLNTRMDRHVIDLSARVDREALDALRAKRGFDLGVWIAAAAAMKADPGRVQAIVQLVKLIPDDVGAAEHAAALLTEVRANKRLYQATHYAVNFWSEIAPLLDFPANVHEGEVTLANAHEAVVSAGWELWEGRRVGRIKPGRKALVVPGHGSRKSLFIRGTQALLKKVIEGGGRLRHHGVTLTYPTDQRPLKPMLMEVTRIDTLAYVDPEAAVALLGDRAPPDGHPLYTVLARARTDAVSARVFADMLIEFAVGIDADVARKLARGR